MKTIKFYVIIISISVTLLASFVLVYFLKDVSSTNTPSNKLRVFTSILPQEYFVKRIGGDRVEVQALVKPGSSPATYEPSPRQMAALSEANLFFRIGVPFERVVLPKIKNNMKNLRVVDTREGVSLRKMNSHSHGAGDNEENKQAAHPHDKDGADPHIWLNPRFVIIQARTIADALIQADPKGKAAYEKNLAAFVKALDGLDAKLKKTFAPFKGKAFMVFHPAWGYFADAYGLKQEPIEIEGKDPSSKQLARIVETARAQDIHIIFVQPQFSRRLAKRVAESIGGKVVAIDPLARDLISNLENAAAKVSDAMKGSK